MDDSSITPAGFNPEVSERAAEEPHQERPPQSRHEAHGKGVAQ
jgi:hypothetical protein